MFKRRFESRSGLAVTALCSLVVACLSLTPPARAGLVGEVTSPVVEATAPVEEAVETVAPPVVTPPPVPPPPEVPAHAPAPPVTAPEVKIPVPPVKVPSVPAAAETAGHAVEAAAGTAAKVTESVGSTGAAVTPEVEKAASGVARETANAATERTGGGSSAAATRAAATGGPTAIERAPTQSGAASAPDWSPGQDRRSVPGESTADDRPGVRAAVPLGEGPFVYVWPAIALLIKSPLGDLLERLSQEFAALYAVNRGRNAAGLEAPVTGRHPGVGDAEKVLSQPADEGWNLLPGEVSEFPTLLFLLGIPVALLLFTIVAKYEEGRRRR